MTDNIPSMEQVRINVMHRIDHLSSALRSLKQAGHRLDEALGSVMVAWADMPSYYESKPIGLKSYNQLLPIMRVEIEEDLFAAAEQFGFLVARDIIADAVRNQPGPVVCLTGNSMMPPLREIPQAEMVYQADDSGALWERFVERLEAKLDEEGITMGQPDYDNALYAVDTRKWQVKDTHYHIDDPNAWLDEDYWEPIPAADN